MDFDFSPEQRAFEQEVVRFLDEHDDPDVFDLTRENMAQIVDTPKRRAFMRELGERGWLGLTWPKEYGGSEGEGVYEYLLNEQLAARGGPQIGKGVGIIGKTLIKEASEQMKQEFLPQILRNDVEFAVGYSEPNAGSDAASMRLKAERGERDGKPGWILNGQKTWTTSAHFAEWYWLGTRTDPDNKHMGITLMLVPLDQPGVTIKGIWTMGDERTNEVFIEDVFVPDEYVVGEVNHGFQYISQALDLERFTMFTFSPMKQRLDLLIDYVNTAVRDGVPLRDDPVVRQRIAQLVTDAEVARVLGLKVVAASMKGEKVPGTPPPTVESSQYKLFATEFSRRLASASMDIGGPGNAAPGSHEDRADGGPGRVDVPLHRDRHDRRRLVGDPEERHRPARARAPEELLIVLQGVTVLDLASVGPAARTSRWLADYGARVVKIGPPPKQSGVQIVPPFYAYSGHRGMERVLLDLKSDAGRDAFLRLAARADVVIESFRPG